MAEHSNQSNQTLWLSLVAMAVFACLMLLAYLSFANESLQEEEMGLLKGEKVCLFSGFTGQLLLNGEPANDAEITRKYEWKNKETRDLITADAQGKFAFESVWESSRGFVVQFVSHQELFVNYQGKGYQIWTGGKLLEEENAEFGGSNPVNLTCELSEEMRRVDMELGFIGTSCRWE